MKTNTELTRAFEAGEISFDQYMTTAAEPDARKPASHYRKSGGKRAAARQGAILAPAQNEAEWVNGKSVAPECGKCGERHWSSVPCNEVLESNSLCAVCGREAVGFKSLCCEANVITPTEYARRAKRAEQLSVDGTPAEVNATVARANRVEAMQQAPLVDPEEGAYVAAPGNLKTAEAALKFLLAGNAYFTVRSLKTGVRYTFRVALAPVKENCTWCRKSPCTCKRPYFVSFLSGPENTSDYTYLGMVTDSVFRITRASQRFADSTVFKAFDYVFRHLVRRELPPQTEIWHEGRCGVCGRPLTVPESIESGIGPVCAGKGGM